MQNNKADYIADCTCCELFLERNSGDEQGTTVYVFIYYGAH